MNDQFIYGQKSQLFLPEETRVWIGDPCYVPGLSEKWDEFLDVFWSLGNCASHVMEHLGVEFVVGSTANGDGCFPTSCGGECFVDAGLLSVIPAEAFGLSEASDDYGGVFATVRGNCYIDQDGTLHAGEIAVVTGSVCENCGFSSCDCCRCDECGEWEEYCDCCDECGETNWHCTCD
jgi:hypothetical protein